MATKVTKLGCFAGCFSCLATALDLQGAGESSLSGAALAVFAVFSSRIGMLDSCGVSVSVGENKSCGRQIVNKHLVTRLKFGNFGARSARGTSFGRCVKHLVGHGLEARVVPEKPPEIPLFSGQGLDHNLRDP